VDDAVAAISVRTRPDAERPDARAFARNACHSSTGTERTVTDVS
jgi:hypothetical protein